KARTSIWAAPCLKSRSTMPELPMTVSRTDLPSHVRIYEVGARDGLQNEKSVIDVDTKVEFIERLLAAGLPVVEATSFVHPKWVPQLADAAEVISRSPLGGPVPLPVLVPNERGLDRALAAGCTDIAIFASATETFASKN